MKKKKIPINFLTIGIAFGVLGFILLFVYNVIDTDSAAFSVIDKIIPGVFFIFMSALFTQLCRARIKDLAYLSANVTMKEVDDFFEQNELSESPKTESEWLIEVSEKPQLTNSLLIFYRIFIVPNIIADCIVIASYFIDSLNRISGVTVSATFIFAFATVFICMIIQIIANRRKR